MIEDGNQRRYSFQKDVVLDSIMKISFNSYLLAKINITDISKRRRILNLRLKEFNVSYRSQVKHILQRFIKFFDQFAALEVEHTNKKII